MNPNLFNLNFTSSKDEFLVPVFLYTISFGEDEYKTFFGKSLVNVDEAIKINNAMRVSYPNCNITSFLELNCDFDLNLIKFQCENFNENVLIGYWQNVLSDIMATEGLKNCIKKAFLADIRAGLDLMQEVDIDSLYKESTNHRQYVGDAPF